MDIESVEMLFLRNFSKHLAESIELPKTWREVVICHKEHSEASRLGREAQ